MLHYGDLTDSSQPDPHRAEVQPDEIYNLGAQSHVAVSFEAPEYTADVDGIGTLRLLEAIRFLGLDKKTPLLPGLAPPSCTAWCRKRRRRKPRPSTRAAPTRVAKLYAYWITVNYREAYGMYACNGILFNHESPRRGETFVTRKITRGLANIAHGPGAVPVHGQPRRPARLGPRQGLRAHAVDDAAAGRSPRTSSSPPACSTRVREFIDWSAAELGITLRFEGRASTRRRIVASVDGDKAPALKVGDVHRARWTRAISARPRWRRCSATRARRKRKLGWVPEITAQRDCAPRWSADDLKAAQRHALLRAARLRRADDARRPA